jgi:hypothetical protein
MTDDLHQSHLLATSTSIPMPTHTSPVASNFSLHTAHRTGPTGCAHNERLRRDCGYTARGDESVHFPASERCQPIHSAQGPGRKSPELTASKYPSTAVGLGVHICPADFRSVICWWDSRPAGSAGQHEHVVAELHHVLLNSDLADMAGKPEDVEWEAAMSMTLGKQDYPPPWPRAPRETAAWQSTETLAALSEHHRQLQTALIQTSKWRS